jgi:hypothetical protein
VYLLVAEIVIRLTLLRGKHSQATHGYGAAFLLASGWLLCLQFMYYDVLLAFVPVILVLSHARLWQPEFLARGSLVWEAVRLHPWSNLEAPPGKDPARFASGQVFLLSLPAKAPYGWIKNPLGFWPILLLFLNQNYLDPHGYTGNYSAFNTYCVLALWLWCAWAWVREQSR